MEIAFLVFFVCLYDRYSPKYSSVILKHFITDLWKNAQQFYMSGLKEAEEGRF